MKQESLKFSGRKTNPATKKFSPAQIAAQKLFAERARAGTLKKDWLSGITPEHEDYDILRYYLDEKKNLPKTLGKGKRKTNPDKAKPRAYVKRASQATGAPPSKRLVTRRKKALTAPAGYFPNPRMKKPFGREAPQKYYEVSKMEDGVDTKFYPIGHFFTFLEAEKYSRYLAKQHRNWSIRVHDKRAM